ncbi:MAG: hypothetical protein NT045_05260 [Candidatus Aureabacteria bacterium]|nr:hypothetical protein [Candidatus Auribacterota bacterium]
MEPIDFSTEQGLETFRHSTSHVMAQAVRRLFPGAKLAIGPAIADGFYYDFELDEPLALDHLEKIEGEMRKVVRENHPFVREEMDRHKAIEFFKSQGERYKVDILEELTDPTVSVYRDGEFIDLCRGPHLESTGQIRAFKPRP